jgi:hypothetical protein
MEHKAPIRWQALEYIYVEKTPDWYWALWIIAGSLSVVAIMFHDLILLILILVAAFTLNLFAVKRPDMLDCEINHRGIRLQKTLYPYAAIDSFWVEDMPHKSPKIILRSKRWFSPYIIIPIEQIDPEEIRDHLRGELAEKEHHESPLQGLMDYLGF